MHTLTKNDSWEIDFMRDDSDIKPDGVTPEDLAGCCDVHYRREEHGHSAEIEITETVHDLELIVTASVYRISLDCPEESMELESEFNVRRVFRGAGCKARASQYASCLKEKIDLQYFSYNEDQLKLPLIFY
ncbi:MAG: hypothetical protein Q8Q01_01140 [archaeon]|nr:hypothetical protein [archaeon]